MEQLNQAQRVVPVHVLVDPFRGDIMFTFHPSATPVDAAGFIQKCAMRICERTRRVRPVPTKPYDSLPVDHLDAEMVFDMMNDTAKEWRKVSPFFYDVTVEQVETCVS